MEPLPTMKHAGDGGGDLVAGHEEGDDYDEDPRGS